jgi:hypothetical protein
MGVHSKDWPARIIAAAQKSGPIIKLYMIYNLHGRHPDRESVRSLLDRHKLTPDAQRTRPAASPFESTQRDL